MNFIVLKNNRFYQIIISLSCLLLYFPVLQFGFSPLDEKWLITDRLNWLNHFSNILSIFSSSDLNMYYRPILSITFFSDVLIGGGSPFMFHLTNILLHIIASLLLFELLKLLLENTRKAFLWALLYAIHPLCVHTVAWIPGRNDSLLCIFVLLHLIFLVNYLCNNNYRSLIISTACFFLALLTKETAILLPIITISTVFLVPSTFDRKKIFSLALPFLFSFIIYIALHLLAIEKTDHPDLTLLTKNSPNAFLSILLYIGKSILPLQQSVMPVLVDSNLLIPVLSIIVLIIATWKLGINSYKLYLLGWIIAMSASIVPIIFSSSGFYKEQYEHRFYLPLVGMIIVFSQIQFEKIKMPGIRFAGYSLLLAFAIKSFVRCKVYKNEETFAKAGLIESPHVELFHTIMGGIYIKKGAFEKAIEEYNIASDLRPGKADIFNNRGYAYASLKQFENSIVDFSSAIRLDSSTDGALVNRAMAYYALKRYDSAKVDVIAAMHLNQKVDKRFIRDLLNAGK